MSIRGTAWESGQKCNMAICGSLKWAIWQSTATAAFQTRGDGVNVWQLAIHG